MVAEYVAGAESRAGAGYHRARFINQDEAGGLASPNAHTAAFGTYSESDPDEDNALLMRAATVLRVDSPCGGRARELDGLLNVARRYPLVLGRRIPARK